MDFLIFIIIWYTILFLIPLSLTITDDYVITDTMKYKCNPSIKKWANFIKRIWVVVVNILGLYPFYYGNVVGVYLGGKVRELIKTEDEGGCK